MANRILVVDDDPQVRMVLRYVLRQGGFEVLEAGDGPDALAHVATGRPDLVLLDLMMPQVNGFAICAALRANPATRHVPVIVLTARTDEDSRLLSLSAGADDYLVKPVPPTELVDRIRETLRANQLGGAAL